MQRLILFFIFLLVAGCGGKAPMNIYDSQEYKNLTKKEILPSILKIAARCRALYLNTIIKKLKHLDQNL